VAIKKGNKMLQITLTPFHLRKLAMIRSKSGLNNSAVIQRLIEGHDLFGKMAEEKPQED